MLTERRQTVRKQYEAVQQRRALQDTTNHPRTTKGPPGPPLIVLGNLTAPALQLSLAPQTGPSFRLDRTQKLQLQQQVQQVRLLKPSKFNSSVDRVGGSSGVGSVSFLLVIMNRTLTLQSSDGSVFQHVQLLTQVHLLSSRVHSLNHEAHLTKRYLVSVLDL